LTETPIDTWEIQAIIRLDQVYMGVYNG
jgi:hypothetical protein